MVPSRPNPATPTASSLTLRRYLSRLVWLCMGPLLLVASYLAIEHLRTLDRQDRAEAANLARNFAIIIDQRLRTRIRALNILADSETIDDTAQWPQFYRLAQRFVREYGNHVILAEAREPMRMLINTRVPLGEPLPVLPKSSGQTAAPTAVATGKPAVGDLVFGPVAKQPLVAIAVPVRREDATPYVLLMITETREFQEWADGTALPAGWGLSLRDGRQALIAHHAALRPDGHPEEGLENVSMPLELAPWTVVVEIPRNARMQPLLASGAALAMAILFALLAGHFGGKFASQRLAREVTALSAITAPAMAPTIREIAEARALVDDSLAKRSQAEAALMESHHLLAESQRIAHIGSYRWDLVTGQIEWSDECYRLFGVTREDFTLTAEAGIACIHPEDKPGVRAWVSAQAAGASPKPITFRTIQPVGSCHWLVTDGEMQRDAEGRPLQLVGTIQDITELRQIQNELRQFVERLELAQQVAGVGVWDWDVVTGHIDWTENMFDLLGLDSNQDTASFESWQRAVHPEDLAGAEARIQQALVERTLLVNEYRVLLPLGQIRWINATGKGIYNENGEPLRMTGTCVDITERHQAEEVLKAQLQELRRWQDVMLDREDRIQALKQEVNELLQRDGQPIRYPSQTHEAYDAREGTP